VSTPLGACYAEEVVLGRRQIYLAYLLCGATGVNRLLVMGAKCEQGQ